MPHLSLAARCAGWAPSLAPSLATALIVSLVAAPAAQAKTHIVKMLNGNAGGAMVYEPEFLQIQPGDSVQFLAAQRGHNAASIPEILPEGARPFLGRINEEITITLTQEGFYGVKCSPHYDMGMVMLIQVGMGALGDLVLPETLPKGARQRLEQIRARAEAGAEAGAGGATGGAQP